MIPMSKTYVLIFTVVALLSFVLPASAADIAWQKDFDTALKVAKDQKKPIMVYFYGTRCGWCTKMANETHSNQTVQELLANKMVSVKLTSSVGQARMTGYGLKSVVPATVFVTPDNMVIYNIVGYQPPEVFVKSINSALANAKDADGAKIIIEKMAKGTATSEEMLKLLGFYNKTGQYPLSSKVVAEIEKGLGEGQAFPTAGVLDRGIALTNTGAPKVAAVSLVAWVEAQTAENSRYYEGMHWAALASAMNDDLDTAEKLWTRIIQEAPTSEWAPNAQHYLEVCAEIRAPQK